MRTFVRMTAGIMLLCATVVLVSTANQAWQFFASLSFFYLSFMLIFDIGGDPRRNK